MTYFTQIHPKAIFYYIFNTSKLGNYFFIDLFYIYGLLTANVKWYVFVRNHGNLFTMLSNHRFHCSVLVKTTVYYIGVLIYAWQPEISWQKFVLFYSVNGRMALVVSAVQNTRLYMGKYTLDSKFFKFT